MSPNCLLFEIFSKWFSQKRDYREGFLKTHKRRVKENVSLEYTRGWLDSLSEKTRNISIFRHSKNEKGDLLHFKPSFQERRRTTSVSLPCSNRQSRPTN